MELRLKGLGTVDIADATRVTGDDILIKSADNFRIIYETTDYEITDVYLTEVDFKWSMVVLLDTPEDNWYEESSLVFQIENQDDIYRLNARL